MRGMDVEVDAPRFEDEDRNAIVGALRAIYARANRMVDEDYSGPDNEPYIPDGWYTSVGGVGDRADAWQYEDPQPDGRALIKELTDTLDRLQREGDEAIRGGRAAKAQRIAMAANEGADVDEEEFEGEETESPYNGVFGFGFDGTLTVVDFKNAKGDDVKALSKYPKEFMKLTAAEQLRNFGGLATVKWLKKLFEKIQTENKLSLRIASYGDYDAIKHALEQVGLLEFFKSHPLFSNREYEIYALSKDPAKNAYEGDEEGEEEVFKDSIVQRWMAELDLDQSEVAFIDDEYDVIFGESDIEKYGAPDSGIVGVVWDDDDPVQAKLNARNVILHRGNIMDAEKEILAILEGHPEEDEEAPEEPESPSTPMPRPNKAQRTKTSLRAKLTKIKISGSQ